MPVEIDYSTLNVEELRQLPEADIYPGCHVSDSRGAGCFMDPPGYPSHFLQSVYNARGNHPYRGSEQVIYHPETGYREIINARGTWDTDTHKALMRRLWVPLPLDSERVQGWLAHAAGYYRGTEYDGPVQTSFYPGASEVQVTPAYGKGSIGDWINLFATRPTSKAECVEQQTFKYAASWGWRRHPLNSTWCQHCGWVDPSAQE